MLFDSYTFIFIFLPIVLLGFYLLSSLKIHVFKIAWLMVASLFFYAWWNLNYLMLLIIAIAINFFLGKAILARNLKGLSNKYVLFFGIAINLIFLGYYKYLSFLISNINESFGTVIPVSNILLPLGISFYTFQNIAFLVDATKGNIREHKFLEFCIFITFFPQLIAGPIVHHEHIMGQLRNLSKLQLSIKRVNIGLTIFLLGLFKKLAFADTISVYANRVFDAVHQGVHLSFWEAWCGVLAYSFQLYFDFSGYSDMAIGLGLLFGIKLPINFFSPYKSTSIIDFWRRWHMTLSRFLRDYLYIPLGGSKNGGVRRYINLLITMLLGGLWHGANWAFMVWGGLHGFFLIINHIWRWFVKRSNYTIFKKLTNSKVFCIPFTFIFVVLAWVPFRADNLREAISIWHSMLTFETFGVPKAFENKFYLVNKFFLSQGSGNPGMFYNELINWNQGLIWLLILTAIVFFMPNSIQILGKNLNFTQHSIDLNFKQNLTSFDRIIEWRLSRFWAFTLALMTVIVVILLSGESEFIYFQF